jgi:hypothetical protein
VTHRILGRGVRPDVAAGRAFLLPGHHKTGHHETQAKVRALLPKGEVKFVQ